MTASRQVQVDRDGVCFTVGDDGDFSWAEMDSLQLQIDRWNTHHPKDKPVKRQSPEMTQTVLDVKRIFTGAVIEHDPGPSLNLEELKARVV